MLPDVVSSEIVSTAGNNFILLVLLVIFIFLAYHAVRLIYRTVLVAFLGALFPFFAYHILNLPISTDLPTILTFALSSAVLYLFYENIRLVFSLVKYTSKLIKAMLYPFVLLGRAIKLLFTRKKEESK